jgi:hypothetical protein
MIAYLHNIETVVIIGWKGNEDAFNRLLFRNGTKINRVIIVDPFPDIIKNNLKPLIDKISKTNLMLFNTFEDFVLNGFENEIH